MLATVQPIRQQHYRDVRASLVGGNPIDVVVMSSFCRLQCVTATTVIGLSNPWRALPLHNLGRLQKSHDFPVRRPPSIVSFSAMYRVGRHVRTTTELKTSDRLQAKIVYDVNIARSSQNCEHLKFVRFAARRSNSF